MWFELLMSGALIMAMAQCCAASPATPANSSTPAAAAPPPPPATPVSPASPAPTGSSSPAGVLDFKLTDIDGKPYDLAQHKGKVVMLVNVASKCGLTPQYAALEKLHDEYKEQGLVVVGLPCNDFMEQEPGTEAEIKTFCSSTYGVSFPMMSKVTIKGASRSPIYQFIIDQPAPIGGGKEPTWNFTKFIVNREGKIVERVEPRTSPADEKVVARIKSLLSEKAPAASPVKEPEAGASAGKPPAPAASPSPVAPRK